MSTITSQMQDQLEYQVLARTGRRIRNLAIEMLPERVILRGQAPSYYIKQLAQHGIHQVFPEVNLENSIVVDHRPLVATGAA